MIALFIYYKTSKRVAKEKPVHNNSNYNQEKKVRYLFNHSNADRLDDPIARETETETET